MHWKRSDLLLQISTTRILNLGTIIDHLWVLSGGGTRWVGLGFIVAGLYDILLDLIIKHSVLLVLTEHFTRQVSKICARIPARCS